jgi:hypothetical protein
VVAGQGNPARQVADQRLAADQELVGERVPGADLDLSGLNGAVNALAVLGADRQVVLDNDRLAVEEEPEGRVGLGQGQQVIPQIDQPGPEPLEWRVPLAVPVRVGNDEDGGRSQGSLRPYMRRRMTMSMPARANPITISRAATQ